jgi:hypothetical protein
MKLLFEDLAKDCSSPERVQKLSNWVKNADSARESNQLDKRANQYDKAEELITFYTFAPLVLSLNRVGLINRILGLAGISPFEENVVSLGLERQYSPPEGYLQWLKKDVKSHQIRYIREKSADHLKTNKLLESPTHVDASIETDKLLIFFEMKFTSDIAHSTTYNPHRNQVARLIDVGIDVAKRSGKEALVLLSTPRKLYERRSRLYYYKVQEYSDPLMVQSDIAWRTISEIKDNLLAVRWIALEDLINLLYKDFCHSDKEEAMKFFRERNLA